jgi:hypothetical protein
MKKDTIEYLKSLKNSSTFNDHRMRAFIDRVIYRLERGLTIDYYPNKDDKRNKIIRIAKDFEKEIKKPEKIEEEKDKETKKPVKKTEKKAKEDKKDGN